jgi:hypothetical protein
MNYGFSIIVFVGLSSLLRCVSGIAFSECKRRMKISLAFDELDSSVDFNSERALKMKSRYTMIESSPSLFFHSHKDTHTHTQLAFNGSEGGTT